MFLKCLITCRRVALIIFIFVVVVFVIFCVILYDCNLDIMLDILARLIEFF